MRDNYPEKNRMESERYQDSADFYWDNGKQPVLEVQLETNSKSIVN